MSQNVQPLWGSRPPAGAWPPCPPGPPGPGLSGLFRLEQCWQDVAQAKTVLKKMIADIIQEDPTFIQGVGIAGVVDGSVAQPGQVGEVVEFASNFAYGTGVSSATLTLGVLPPGDWNVWGWAGFTTLVTGAQMYLNPAPAGFIGAGNGTLWPVGATTPESLTLVTLTAVARTSVPSLMALSVLVNSTAAGTMTIAYLARRMR